MAFISPKIDLVSRNLIFTSMCSRENKILPTPIHFSQTTSSITSAIPSKITQTDPRHLKNGTSGLTESQKARYVKIRDDLEHSYNTFPRQKYATTQTSAQEIGWNVNDRSVNIRKSHKRYFRGKRNSEITKFVDEYCKSEGSSPFCAKKHK
ncbi:hypothetical protein TL16_g08294 [Triparma laevis f. inornata]|uniref:Uncharacterized protein n=2 Tax=Triparma laevis TaxID=1534972 RepID=A0A9W7ALY0_9STRA|nr:hypothetical protein TrLO_g447 [Triparma laevis f. longispina]GMH79850.1 hypothetical protein TL16_g08294 [Triparma laevis f. inornata]